ncbi:MAG: glycosyltransferase [Pedobacter sp.]
MNILFISFDADPPYMGGTATVANILAKSFQSFGHFCALAYPESSEHPSTFFADKLELNQKNRVAAELFFKKHQFDIILNQLPTNIDFKFLLSLPLGNCKIISAYHNRPMLRPLTIDNLKLLYSKSTNLLHGIYTLIKFPLLPLLNIKNRRQQLQAFDDVCNYSDRILLLSEKFYPLWKTLAPNTDVSKLVAIGNPLVFEESLPIEEVKVKEKLVITVCAITAQKRAHLLLEIWRLIENDQSFDEWKFVFVGGGVSLSDLKLQSKEMGLKRLDFVGYQSPYSYYKRAAISLMTSKYEGWPMVLMEGQQMGVVPISYDSFESITDIIDNEKNGLIIPNNDLEGFVEKLKKLMRDKVYREEMATSAIYSSDRFSIDKVTFEYLRLFYDLFGDDKKK